MQQNSSPEITQTQLNLSPKEVEHLESAGILLRVLCPEMLGRIEKILQTKAHKAHPYIAGTNGQVFISVATIQDEETREIARHVIRRCQVGDSVEIRYLPAPLQSILKAKDDRPLTFWPILALSGVIGTIMGVLAMAVSVLAISAAELVIHASLNDFGGIQITAVSFVIFAVLGCFATAMILLRRFNH